FDRHREGRHDIRDPAELDREVRRGHGVRRLEDRDRVRLPEEPEELVEHDVRGDLRVLEEAGRLLELAGNHLQLEDETHGATRARIRASLFNDWSTAGPRRGGSGRG